MTGDASWCPTPDCKYAFIYDPENDSKEFNCPRCSKHYCLKCRVEWHTDLSCEEYEESKDPSDEDKSFKSYARGAKFKQCPKCKVWVEKSEGCDHMKCRCGSEFCYACGGKYKECACYKSEEQYLRNAQLINMVQQQM